MNTDETNEAMGAYNDFLNNMIGTLDRIVDELQAGEDAGFPAALPAVIDGLELLLTDATNLLGEHYKALESLVRQLGQAMENADYGMLRDLIEFELIPLLQQSRLGAKESN